MGGLRVYIHRAVRVYIHTGLEANSEPLASGQLEFKN